MDFDEYEYLEKTVENPELVKENQNGRDAAVKSEERGRSNRSSKHRDIEKDGDDDGDYDDFKHSKSRDYDRQKERGSLRRHRSRSRDGEKEKDRHRSSEGDRDRKRGRERESEDKHGGRERDRERERNRAGESEREREKEGLRRSRSRSERLIQTDLDDRDRERSRDNRDHRAKDRSQDKDFRDRERVRESRELRDREGNNRQHKEKKEEKAEPEVDPERDQRTVFAYQISLKADERDVYEFFSRAGKVRDVRLIMDRNSRRSKGVGYIEFYDVMSVPMAIALSGQPLLGQPVMVKPSEAEKNLVQSTASVANGSNGVGPYSGGARRVYVGNLHFNITEADLRGVFEAFGQVELVQLPPDESGQCKGFGFVQFARLEDARNSLSLNGQLEIGGRTIKVSAVTDQNGMQEAGGNAGDFDDDEGGGLSLNASSRALLMQKLDRSGGTTSSMVGSLGDSAVNNTGLNLPEAGSIPVGSLPGLPGGGLQIPYVDTIGVPSECLMLKNMFDPKDETEPDFDLDIKEDVEAECSKFGKLNHIYVDKKSAGFVYLRFEETQAAIGAQRALHGRWFAGKMITASFMVPQTYEDRFPDSR